MEKRTSRKTTLTTDLSLSGTRPRTIPTREEIAVRADELFLEHGSVSGHELDDWLEAEREFTAPSLSNSVQGNALAPSVN